MSGERIEIGRLVLYPQLRRVEAGGIKVKICGKQWEFLAALGECAGTLVTRKYLLVCLYPDPQGRPDVRSIDMLAHFVRRKLSNALDGANYIHPIPSEGYILRASG